MIRLRGQQLDEFAALGRQQFEQRALAYLHDRHPAACAERGDEELRRLLRHLEERVRPWGLDSEAGVVVCAELSLVYGDEFYRREWARYVFFHSDLDRPGKVERLQRYVDEEWDEEAREAYDA